MGRELYSKGFFGGLRRDRKAERARDGVPGIPARPFVVLLLILTAIIVLASVVGH